MSARSTDVGTFNFIEKRKLKMAAMFMDKPVICKILVLFYTLYFLANIVCVLYFIHILTAINWFSKMFTVLFLSYLVEGYSAGHWL